MQLDDPFAAPNSVVADPSGSSGAVPPGVVETLRRTKGWVRFLAVMGLIGAGLSLLFGVFVGAAGMLGGGIFEETPAPAAVSVAYAVFMVLLSTFYLFPCLRLLRYATGIERLEQWRDAARLEQALEHQRAFWRLVGWFTIAMLVLYAMVIVVAVVFGVMIAARNAA